MPASDEVSQMVMNTPPPVIHTDPDILISLSRDSADLFGEDKPALPVAAVRPTTTAEVAAAVKLAARHLTPVVAQGARTGLAAELTSR